MKKKLYEEPKIELVRGITEDFLSESDEIIILPPHEFKVF